MTILSWLEMPEDDRPPDRIWLDDEAIESFFIALADRHKNGPSGPKWESVPPGEDMMQNDFTAHLKKG